MAVKMSQRDCREEARGAMGSYGEISQMSQRDCREEARARRRYVHVRCGHGAPLTGDMGDMGRYGEISQVLPWSPSHGSPALARGRAVRQEQWSRTLGTQAAAPPCLAGTSFSLPSRRPSRRSDYSTTTRRGASRSRTCGASPRSWYPKPPSPTPTVPEPTLPSPTVPEPTLVQGENMTDGELQQVPRATL